MTASSGSTAFSPGDSIAKKREGWTLAGSGCPRGQGAISGPVLAAEPFVNEQGHVAVMTAPDGNVIVLVLG